MAGGEEEEVGWDGVEARHREKTTGLLYRDEIAGGMALCRQREQQTRRSTWGWRGVVGCVRASCSWVVIGRCSGSAAGDARHVGRWREAASAAGALDAAGVCG
jgi:hypothetical protein